MKTTTTRPSGSSPGRRRRLLAGALTIGCALPAVAVVGGPAAVGAPSSPGAAASPSTVYVQPETPPDVDDLTPAQRAELERYLTDTYASLTAMTDPTTGLPADNIEGDLAADSRSAYTSPTNIGGYLWSTIVARDAGILTAQEARDLMSTTLTALEGMDRHDSSGMFYNWYDPATGDLVLTWPDNGNHVNQFLSSVDNGWLAAGLRIVASAEPTLADQAQELYDSMNFGVFYNAQALPDRGLGLIRGGFWDTEPVDQGGWVIGDYLGTGEDLYYTGHHYDTTVSETRIATYLGIANGQIPAETYYATWRTFPSTCDWSWQEQRPSGVTRSYDGVEVFEGVYHYRGMSIVPGWGGSMFEALMPDMLVPESEWGPRSWGVNHPLVVKAQKEHGLVEAGYGAWGFSPASNPHGGYLEYGVEQLGLNSTGYTSDGVTDVDAGFFDCRDGVNPTPDYGDGVVTPHASFLGLAHDPLAVLENARVMEEDLDAYGPGGFYDAIAVTSGTIAERYLSLDQSMIVAAIGNYLQDGVLREHFVDDELEQALRPVMEAEIFSASTADVVPVVAAPADGTRVPGPTVSLSGTGEPGAVLTVTSEVARAAAVCEVTVDAEGRWSCDVELADGRYVLAATTVNLAGVTTAGAPVTVEVAPDPQPTPTPTGPTSPPTETPTTTPPTAVPTTTAPPVTSAPSAAAPTARATAAAGRLAATGSNGALTLAVVAGAALLAGGGVLLLRRRLGRG